MSAETRESAEKTKTNLQVAEKHLKLAEQHAGGTGDSSLQQTVKKLREGTEQTHQEITRKLGKETG